MKVILLQELKGKGGEGDVVDVAPGFANNYLMPQGIAILATKGNLKQLEMRKNNIAKREATRLADADKLKSVLDGASVKVDAKVGEEGQLFGSVTATQIAEAIKEALGVEIDRRRIEAGKAIKTAGQRSSSPSTVTSRPRSRCWWASTRLLPRKRPKRSRPRPSPRRLLLKRPLNNSAL